MTSTSQAPETCQHCGAEIVLDVEAEIYSNDRPLTDQYDQPWFCPANDGGDHAPIL